MTHPKHLAGSLLAFGICIAMQPLKAAETSTDFRIMTPEEVATHSAAMSTLQGEAREAYRNAHYEQLRARASERGFNMPPTPPWAASAQPDPAAAAIQPAETGADPDAAGAAARHAAMREKMQEHREAVQSAEAKQPAPQQAAGPEQPQLQDQPPLSATLTAAEPTESKPADVADTAVPSSPAPQEMPAPQESQAAQEAPANTPAASVEPRFAPVEEAVVTTVPAPPAPDAAPMADGSAVAAQAAPADAPATGEAGRPYAGSDAMTAYRETMRSRFDKYMQERQAQLQDAARRQREQHEAEMERQRALQAERTRIQPYAYPAMPSYGPRYPEAFPGYRTPYWQQR